MSVVILIAIGIALLLVLAFFAVNRWSRIAGQALGFAPTSRCPDRIWELAGLVSTERNLA